MDGKTFAVISWVAVIAAGLFIGPIAALLVFAVAFVAWFFVGRRDSML